MRVIVTRPAAQAAMWVAALQERGIDAVALPLIEIAAPDAPGKVSEAWRTLALHRLVVFVSPNAADQFFMHRPPDMAWPMGVTAASVGPGTTQSLLRQGVPAASVVEPASDAAQFDSEALWQRLHTHDWAGSRVLIVRGDGGREWLADTLRAQGAHVDFVAAYRRVAPCLEGEPLRTLEQALQRPREHLWFFSSSEAIDNLLHARATASWGDARAIATHPRIVQRARDAGFGHVIPARPALDAVVACIQSVAS